MEGPIINDKQINIFGTWYTLEANNLPLILQSIAKLSLICHMDDNYHMKKSEAQTLLTLSDLIIELIKAQETSA